MTALTRVKYDHEDSTRLPGLQSARSSSRVLKAEERQRISCEESAHDLSPGSTATDDGDADEPRGAADTHREWTARLVQVEEDSDEEPADNGCPSFMCFDFKGQALPEILQPLPIQDVRGYPQEVLGKLKNYLAAKFSLLHLLRRTADGGYKVDLRAYEEKN